MSKAKKQKNANKHRALSAQQTIPYIAMHPDGICQLPGGLYTKTLEYEDINYAVASTEDQTAIISGWSACLNYFDSSLPFQLSFVNRRSRNANRYKVNIPAQEDDFNSIRGEYVEMLKGQIAKSNNGIERYKYITFGLPAEGVATWCYFDEFHILLRDPLTASYFVAVWKMLRKKGCVPSALTQNVKDLLASREIENILDNTDFMVLLSQAQSDRAILAKQLGISEHQLSYITHSNSGEGLLFYGNVTIPFVDRFPRGEIYDLLTTRPEDLAHERTDE